MLRPPSPATSRGFRARPDRHPSATPRRCTGVLARFSHSSLIHNSKMVLPIVNLGPPNWTRTDLTPLLVSEVSRVQLLLQHTVLATCLSTRCTGSDLTTTVAITRPCGTSRPQTFSGEDARRSYDAGRRCKPKRSNGGDSTTVPSGSLRDLHPTPDLSCLKMYHFCWVPTGLVV